MADYISEYHLAKTKRKSMVLSILIPGLGQIYVGNFTRGTIIFISALALLFFSYLILNVFEFIPPFVFYIWQIFDAGREYDKRRYNPVQGNITCMDCDWSNSSFSEFCGKCGKRIQIVCTNCNNLNIIGVLFCGKCGKNLSTQGYF